MLVEVLVEALGRRIPPSAPSRPQLRPALRDVAGGAGESLIRTNSRWDVNAALSVQCRDISDPCRR